ncbi:lipoprotein [Vulgatibacter sp.]|uniref:lipoprotein n=1 Tax=Vulgatibacter sp. TaxID=1971226 RepID=UPI003561BC67
MKRMFLALAAIFVVAGCQNQGQEPAAEQEPQAQAPAGEPQAQQPAAQQPAAEQQMMTATGTITEVSDEKITVRTAAGEQMEMKLGEQAQITMNGQPVQKDQLQQGASVRAAYKQEGEENTVQTLEIQSMGAQQPGAAPQPEGAQQPPQPQQ